ncbi:hypothetical protein [uncultured Desulfobacter sp.]|uniref:hypothetical protein n=1 Tax=uncultured Desulfobacter sp. TaxID=240139 RepID=UPI002AAADB84|nr:hypothetical protein [uncultured Desulfobacter sp.]
MTETITFRPKLRSAVKSVIFHFCLLGTLLYCWNSMDSVWRMIFLIIAIIPTLFIIGYLKPIIFVQNVIIGKDKTITIRHWFGKGHTEKIGKALYEVVKINEDDIRSYRFHIQGRRFQVSPCVYEREDDLSEILKPFARRKNISIKPAIVGRK